LTVATFRKPGSEPSSVEDRRALLEAELRSLAADHSEEFYRAIETVIRLSAEVAEGGESYIVGVREIARQLQGGLKPYALNVRSLLDR
jgi:hypothetical protein